MASSHRSFSIKEAISYGWRGVIGHLGFFVPLSLLMLGITILFQIVHGILQENDIFLLAFILTLAYVVLQFIMALGIIRISLDFVQKKKLQFSDLFTQYPLIVRYVLSTIVMVVPMWVVGGVGIGLIILFVTGALGDVPFIVPVLVGLAVLAFVIYWQTKLQFYSYFMVDKKTGVVESLKRSFRATDGCFWKLFWLGLLLGLINLLGLLALGIGLLITIPLDWVARAHVYNKLASK